MESATMMSSGTFW